MKSRKIPIDRSILFSQCEFFIDYHSSENGSDRSLRLGNQLRDKYGAQIVEQPHRSTTTHLIFKNGNIQTKFFAEKYQIPLIDPLWLEHCIEKRRLVSIDRYRISTDENENLDFDRLTISRKEILLPSTEKVQNDDPLDENVHSTKKRKKLLYTPNRNEFDQGNFDHQHRLITSDQLGLNLPHENHQFIHRYGCSVARRQNPSSPTVHFTNTIRERNLAEENNLLFPWTTFDSDLDLDQQSIVLETRPQSTPIASKETFLSPKKSEEIFLVPPPPLVRLMHRKYPQQLIEMKSFQCSTSKEDLPNSPANYSFFFYQFSPIQIDEAKRLTRRMGDCFFSDILDLNVTHILLHQENSIDCSSKNVSLELLLGILYGCRLVTFDWLKSSSHIGEWLNLHQFEPKQFFQNNSSLNFYRKCRQQQKAIELFHQCGHIYLTSIAQQRDLLLKLICLLGGFITVNRNTAQIVVGRSSKSLPVLIYPHVNEQWIIDSIFAGQCLPFDNYLIEN